MRKIRCHLVNPLDRDNVAVLADHVIGWENGAIAQLRPFDPARDSDAEDSRDRVALPGLIDLHTHLSQYRIRGQYEPALLPWLDRYVFPAEALSRDPAYAQGIAEEFFGALFAAGTTTSVIYTAPFQSACDSAFETAKKLGARAFIGMTLMDRHSPQTLLQTTDAAFSQSVELWQSWDRGNPLLRYIFTPRFAVSCSAELMARVGAFAAANEAWVQIHLSENWDEIAFVRETFGAASYTDVYDQAGLLTPRALLGHAIHLSEAELETIAARGAKAVHCPDSNFYLKSGEFRYQQLSDHGIGIGLGSDVAAGTSLNLLYHAKLANFRQSSTPLLPARLIWHLTLGNASLLGLDSRIGSLEPGKEADLCFLQLPPGLPVDDRLPSALCFCGHEYPVRETVIAGRTVFSSQGYMAD